MEKGKLMINVKTATGTGSSKHIYKITPREWKPISTTVKNPQRENTSKKEPKTTRGAIPEGRRSRRSARRRHHHLHAMKEEVEGSTGSQATGKNNLQ